VEEIKSRRFLGAVDVQGTGRLPANVEKKKYPILQGKEVFPKLAKEHKGGKRGGVSESKTTKVSGE